ncbi:hypothetical protein NDU88_001262 [Pleurodeles waltl]|uniref:Uncharacterized protein n=1 Tax=Pleurodeles waltl TaxID=8319 RepID=A0AAV7P870_PLEWA|nr:hypothetical protein NDU88_001262 [Pleurodeles waltl]
MGSGTRLKNEPKTTKNAAARVEKTRTLQSRCQKRDVRPLGGPTRHHSNKRARALSLPRDRSNSVATTKSVKENEKSIALAARTKIVKYTLSD